MNCHGYQEYYYEYIKDRKSVSAEISGHIDGCDNCQEQVSRLENELQSSIEPDESRQLLRKHLSLHADLMNKWVSCRQVRPFIPALLIDYLHISQPSPVIAHIEKCTKCKEHFEQIKSLKLSTSELTNAARYLAQDTQNISNETRQVLEQINVCEESGIETRMMSIEQSNSVTDADSGSSITQVRYKSQQSRNVRLRSFKYILAGGISVAALVMLMMLPTTATGLNLGQLSRSVKAVSNIHLERFSGNGEMIQEIWISRPLGFKLYKQSQTSLFKDLRTGKIIQRKSGGEAIYLNEGSREEETYARILPFEQVKDLPAKYDWSYKGDAESENGQDLRIYELSWDYINSGIVINKKWRAYLDPESHLPYVIEWLERTPAEDEYSLITTSRIDYPTGSICLEELEKEGFQRFLNEVQAE